jgi:hypothetical protein
VILLLWYEKGEYSMRDLNLSNQADFKLFLESLDIIMAKLDKALIDRIKKLIDAAKKYCPIKGSKKNKFTMPNEKTWLHEDELQLICQLCGYNCVFLSVDTPPHCIPTYRLTSVVINGECTYELLSIQQIKDITSLGVIPTIIFRQSHFIIKAVNYGNPNSFYQVYLQGLNNIFKSTVALVKQRNADIIANAEHRKSRASNSFEEIDNFGDEDIEEIEEMKTSETVNIY